MTELEIFVLEFLAVDGLASSTIAASEITTLAHEAGNHSMESGALIMKWLATLAHSFLTYISRTSLFKKLKNRAIPVHKARKFSAVLGTMLANN